MGTGESKPLKIIGIASAGWASFFDLLAACILFHPDAWATEMVRKRTNHFIYQLLFWKS